LTRVQAQGLINAIVKSRSNSDYFRAGLVAYSRATTVFSLQPWVQGLCENILFCHFCMQLLPQQHQTISPLHPPKGADPSVDQPAHCWLRQQTTPRLQRTAAKQQQTPPMQHSSRPLADSSTCCCSDPNIYEPQYWCRGTPYNSINTRCPPTINASGTHSNNRGNSNICKTGTLVAGARPGCCCCLHCWHAVVICYPFCQGLWVPWL
jgi:hypothetical protein